MRTMDSIGRRINALNELMEKPFEVGSNADKVKEGLVEVEGREFCIVILSEI